MKSIEKNIEFLAILLFFFAGLFFIKTYAFLSILVFLFLILINRVYVSKTLILVWTLSTFSVILPLTIGSIHGDMYLDNEYLANYLIINSLNAYLCTYIFSNLKINIQKYCIYSISLGLFINSIFSVFFSIFKGLPSGYGNVYNPFSGEFINSPALSMNLLIPTIVFSNIIFKERISKIIKLVLFISVFLCFFGAVYLGGRTYFIIIFIIFIRFSFLNFSKINNNAFKTILLTLLLSSLSIFLFKNSDFFETIITRFEGGIESKRFSHYADGIEKLLTHPFGGYTVDHTIEQVKWFHNGIIDLGRFAGWFSTLFISIFVLFSLHFIFLKNWLSSYINIACILMIMTDVIFEANHIIFLIFLMCFISSSKKKIISTK